MIPSVPNWTTEPSHAYSIVMELDGVQLNIWIVFLRHQLFFSFVWLLEKYDMTWAFICCCCCCFFPKKARSIYWFYHFWPEKRPFGQTMCRWKRVRDEFTECTSNKCMWRRWACVVQVHQQKCFQVHVCFLFCLLERKKKQFLHLLCSAISIVRAYVTEKHFVIQNRTHLWWKNR